MTDPGLRPLMSGLLLLLSWVGLLGAEDRSGLSQRLDHANKLYEQGRYREAAAGYQALLDEQPGHPALQFNLGNAWFKSGDLGRAIAAYRLAQRSWPRDPSIRFNLAFARKQLPGLPPPQQAAWEQAITTLTPNEWTVGAAIAFWLWMSLLILRELFAGQRSRRPYLLATLLLMLLALAGLGLSLYQTHHTQEAVVVAANASVRYGPLSESQMQFQLRDGAEVRILDRKQVQEESWFRVQDSNGRRGWIPELDLLLLTH